MGHIILAFSTPHSQQTSGRANSPTFPSLELAHLHPFTQYQLDSVAGQGAGPALPEGFLVPYR